MSAFAARAGAISRRMTRLLVALWLLVTLSFLMVHLIPGDPVRASLGLTAPLELVEARRTALGLDRPLHEQYGAYLKGLATGELGTSFTSQLPVAQIIAQRLPATLSLAGLALAIVLPLGAGIGLAMAVVTSHGRRPRADAGFDAASGIVTAMPEFVTAVALTALFAVALPWLPVAGLTGPKSYILPLAALSLGPSAVLARIVRVEGVKVLQQEYMRTAGAKRLRWPAIYLRHALPNLLTATLTVGGLILGSLIAGTVLVEHVFAWPGLGSAVVLAITQKDLPLTQGLVLTLGTIVLIVNAVVDLLIVSVDPRSSLRVD
ncbi:ABC transporter permease [Sphingoaurantiacus capsulatus]|uniref:ABC transporter permease n=1 Tax=Sphingoaurantiacus capsulatus TaxID=1771310 RepID=A0ABV7XEC4_9SPHN